MSRFWGIVLLMNVRQGIGLKNSGGERSSVIKPRTGLTTGLDEGTPRRLPLEEDSSQTVVNLDNSTFPETCLKSLKTSDGMKYRKRVFTGFDLCSYRYSLPGEGASSASRLSASQNIRIVLECTFGMGRVFFFGPIFLCLAQLQAELEDRVPRTS
ncbi:hypothetical protein TNIN_405381 [Trichonephila inaurata madagascariensis]|uniref:Uncharacterized protein n=1 Tax=Trichonephila inaurata madagascariensis TaxID=2747483 RepID=A0A8X6YAK2_9ARAC|nr:hypothetical protein TNIN_405381 [Trichonephila inaurata madagascariensis]